MQATPTHSLLSCFVVRVCCWRKAVIIINWRFFIKCGRPQLNPIRIQIYWNRSRPEKKEDIWVEPGHQIDLPTAVRCLDHINWQQKQQPQQQQQFLFVQQHQRPAERYVRTYSKNALYTLRRRSRLSSLHVPIIVTRSESPLLPTFSTRYTTYTCCCCMSVCMW